MSATSEDKQQALESAWRKCQNNQALIDYLLLAEDQAAIAVSGGSVKSQGGFQRTEFFDSSCGHLTQQSRLRMYREIISTARTAFAFLKMCALYGLDPFLTDFSFFPQNNQPVVGQPVIIDTTGRFAIECDKYGVPTASVINQPFVGQINDNNGADAALFVWLMYHEVPCYESHNDYGQMRVSEGAQFT